MSNFERCISLVLGHEGGFTRDSRDRGNWTTGIVGQGELKGTKYGISAMAYPDLDIKNLTYEDAVDVYEYDYWLPLRCEEMPLPVAYLTLDNAVNAGRRRAAQWLQRSVGVKADGVIGDITLSAVEKANQRDLIGEIAAYKIHHYMSLSHLVGAFGLGWARRGIKSYDQAIGFLKEEIQESSDLV